MSDVLAPQVWERRIYRGGWVTADDDYSVVEPATGATLGRMGLARPDDVNMSVVEAQRAQVEWATTPYDDRARVLRRAARLFLEYSDELSDWTSRESGAPRNITRRLGSIAAEECYEAAGLASAPYGELLRSHQHRLSFSRRVAV